MRKWVPTLALLALLAPATALPQTKSAPAQAPAPAPAPAAAPAAAAAAPPAAASNSKSGVYEQLNLFGEAFERIRQDAVEPVGDRRLIETAIAGMLAGLDPNSSYLSEDDYKQRQGQQTTEPPKASIGLVVTIQSGQLKVVSPRDGSPAAAAGIKPGEAIFAIDKEPVFDLTLAEIEARLKGPPDSEVTLTTRGSDGKPAEIKIKRAAGQLPTVSAHLEGGDIGYLRIAGFDAQTQAALTAAMQNVQQQASGKLVGYVLDLRNNPGGQFDVAVAAADDFLDKGDIALVKGRKGDDAKHIAATPGDLANGLPIVALVNGGTASEAELLAGALQDNHRAVLVGTKTFGQSAIETLIPLNGNGAIRLATARFQTPNGRVIQGKGLEPDLTVVPVKLEKLASGMSRHEADLRGALKNTDPVVPGSNPANPAAKPGTPGDSQPDAAATPPAGATPAAPPKETALSVSTGELGGSQDEQLTQALDMLRGLALVTARNNR
ncbi:MAG: S41 family peptidase [Alphaproteobacteria bacterium]|nr:S41 family peptidase [Alphaproteobacteria bacterium]